MADMMRGRPPGYRYLVEWRDDSLSLEEQLNRRGLQGWRFSAFTPKGHWLVFEREFDGAR